MAYFNFLSNECSGRMGDTYYRNENGRDVFTQEYIDSYFDGTRKEYNGEKGEIIMCSRIGPYHGSEVNKKSWKAFTRLQRVAAAYYKYTLDFLGLNTKGRNPLNVVAHFLGILVKGHEFNPYNIYQKIPMAAQLEIEPPIYNEERGTFEVSYTNNLDTSESLEPQLLFCLFMEDGTNLGVKAEWQKQSSFAFATKYSYGQKVYIMCLVSVLTKTGRLIISSKVADTNLAPVVNEMFYPKRLNNGQWRYQDPEVCVGENVIHHYEDETLTFS